MRARPERDSSQALSSTAILTVALALAVVARLCRRRLTWRAMVVDLRVGTLRYAQADLHNTALLVDLRTDNVLRHPSAWLVRRTQPLHPR
jgi:hypothetical protein